MQASIEEVSDQKAFINTFKKLLLKMRNSLEINLLIDIPHTTMMTFDDVKDKQCIQHHREKKKKIFKRESP